MRFFRFKQFQITDERSAMKVGTDSVILGAWVSNNDVSSILDIGSGSGLISLMLAQRIPEAKICAVEIEDGASQDALYNSQHSDWSNRIKVIQKDIRTFTSERKFDLIVSNPPFFTGSLLPNGEKRVGARHDTTLSLADLILTVDRLLSIKGVFALVYPYERQTELQKIAKKFNLYARRILYTHNRPNAPIKRSFIEFVRNEVEEPVIDLLSIRDMNNNYSEDYKLLTKDFYLNF